MKDLHHPCEHWAEPISLAAAGCLSADEEREVRLHIETCSGCRERFRELMELCGALAEAKLPADGVEAAIVERVMSAVTSSESRLGPLSLWERVRVRANRVKNMPSPPAPLPKGEGSFSDTQVEAVLPRVLTRSLDTWRWIMRSPVSRVAAAIIFVVAIGGIVVWFHGGGTTFAFADFVKPILEAKTAKFKITSEGEMSGHAIKATAQVMVLGVGRQRQEVESEMPDKSKMKMVMIFDSDKGKSLTLEPRTKRAMLLTMTNMPKGKMSMDKDPLGWLRLLLSDARDKPDFKREPLGEKEIDGRRVVGFRINTNGGVVSLWGDPKTGLPVRAEVAMTMFGNAKMTLSDFQFNVEMDESLFSLEPPACYTLQDMGTIDMSPAEEKDLIETFREYSKLKQPKQPLSTKDVYSPTGEDYHYEATPKGFILSSCGEDGIYGNADDVMLIDGVETGLRHELYPLQEEKKDKAKSEAVPKEGTGEAGSIKAKPVKAADVADAEPIDPKIKALGEAVAKRFRTFSDEETLVLKDGQTGQMKIKKNITPVAEIRITPHFVKDGTTIDMEGVDATGKAIEGSKATSGTIHNAQTEGTGLAKAFFEHGEGIICKIQLHRRVRMTAVLPLK